MAVGCHSEVVATPGNGAPVSGASATSGSEATVNVPVVANPEETKPNTDKATPSKPVLEDAIPREPEEDDSRAVGVTGDVDWGPGVGKGVPVQVPGGLQGGVVGGVPGGVVGGVVGGIPGGSLTPPSRGPNEVLRSDDPELTSHICPKLSGAPEYPKKARDANVETTLVAACIVEKDGKLACHLVKTHALLDQSMTDFLAKQRVTPFTTRDGDKARVRCIYSFRFKLN